LSNCSSNITAEALQLIAGLLLSFFFADDVADAKRSFADDLLTIYEKILTVVSLASARNFAFWRRSLALVAAPGVALARKGPD
jgi:hypothetical protein